MSLISLITFGGEMLQGESKWRTWKDNEQKEEKEEKEKGRGRRKCWKEGWRLGEEEGCGAHWSTSWSRVWRRFFPSQVFPDHYSASLTGVPLHLYWPVGHTEEPLRQYGSCTWYGGRSEASYFCIRNSSKIPDAFWYYSTRKAYTIPLSTAGMSRSEGQRHNTATKCVCVASEQSVSSSGTVLASSV